MLIMLMYFHSQGDEVGALVCWEVVAGEKSFPVSEDVDAEGDRVVLGR